MRLENCCVKEIRRGKSPKYAEISNVIVFAQKCNTKYNGIDISLAQYLDETTIKRYPTDEHMQDGDIVINSSTPSFSILLISSHNSVFISTLNG